MRRTAAIAGVLVQVASGGLDASDRIDRYVKSEMQLNAIPGVAVAVVEAGADPLVRAYGSRNISEQDPMTVDTPTELASVSKSLTALAVLEVEASGAVGLDTGIGTVLPELNSGDWESVTVRDLLRHRSGLRREHDFLVPCCGLPDDLDLEVAVERLASANLAASMPPRFSYANSNFVLLAAIVERLSGLTFPRFMQERVFAPLDLQKTTLDGRQAYEWNASARHEWQWARVRVSRAPFVGWYGSSRVKATASDMGRYLAAMLGDAGPANGLPTLGPEWWAGLEPGYDLGWFVEEADWLDGGLVLEHSGDIWGANTAIVIAPRHRTGVAVLTNLDAGRAQPIARSILASLHGAPLVSPMRAKPLARPDTWAIAFVLGGVLLLGWAIALACILTRQLRNGRRRWSAGPARTIRSAILCGLGLWLADYFFWRPNIPRETLPTTVGQALPGLVAATSGLLFVVAAAGLFPKSKR